MGTKLELPTKLELSGLSRNWGAFATGASLPVSLLILLPLFDLLFPRGGLAFSAPQAMWQRIAVANNFPFSGPSRQKAVPLKLALSQSQVQSLWRRNPLVRLGSGAQPWPSQL